MKKICSLALLALLFIPTVGAHAYQNYDTEMQVLRSGTVTSQPIAQKAKKPSRKKRTTKLTPQIANQICIKKYGSNFFIGAEIYDRKITCHYMQSDEIN